VLLRAALLLVLWIWVGVVFHLFLRVFFVCFSWLVFLASVLFPLFRDCSSLFFFLECKLRVV
jgi:hypothetical protein